MIVVRPQTALRRDSTLTLAPGLRDRADDLVALLGMVVGGFAVALRTYRWAKAQDSQAGGRLKHRLHQLRAAMSSGAEAWQRAGKAAETPVSGPGGASG